MSTEGVGPAEYALIQELFINPRVYIPSHPKHIAKSLQEPAFVECTNYLEDTPDVQSFAVPETTFTPEIDVQDDGADDILAKSIQIFPPGDILKLSIEATIPHIRFSHAVSKLELPSLRSDPRHDLKALGRAVGDAQCLGFFRKPTPLPREPVDDTKDEGLGLPLSAVHFHDQLARGAELDELDYTEEDLAYVAESTFVDWSKRDFDQLIDLEMVPAMDRVETMTPPLITMPFEDVEDAELFIPDADVCEIPQFSDPESLLEEDLEESRHNLAVAYDDIKFLDTSTTVKIQPMLGGRVKIQRTIQPPLNRESRHPGTEARTRAGRGN
ncbi:hypothetical protein BDP67DRAFT_587614 [Colletotrichum lupini]|nr:hypothetical protein BDP67DRAFT_587614 [Colletotrichum lupini]